MFRSTASRAFVAVVAFSVTLSLPARADEQLDKLKRDMQTQKIQSDFGKTVEHANEATQAQRERNAGVGTGYGGASGGIGVARAGFEFVLARPLGTEGFDPKLGYGLGFGLGTSAIHADVSILRWGRQDSARSYSAYKIPIGLAYRGDFGIPVLWWQAGIEGGYESQDCTSDLGSGSVSALFWGVTGGLGASLPLGPVVLSASWSLHYDWRAMHSSDVLSDADEASWGDHNPFYQVFALALGFRSE